MTTTRCSGSTATRTTPRSRRRSAGSRASCIRTSIPTRRRTSAFAAPPKRTRSQATPTPRPYDRFGHAGVAGRSSTRPVHGLLGAQRPAGRLLPATTCSARGRAGRPVAATRGLELSLADAAFGVAHGAGGGGNGLRALRRPRIRPPACPTSATPAAAPAASAVAQTAFRQFVQTGTCRTYGGRGVVIEHLPRNAGGGRTADVRDVESVSRHRRWQRLRLPGPRPRASQGAAGRSLCRRQVAQDPASSATGTTSSRCDLPFSQASLGAEVSVERWTVATVEVGRAPAGQCRVLRGKGPGAPGPRPRRHRWW